MESGQLLVLAFVIVWWLAMGASIWLIARFASAIYQEMKNRN
jgi:hypothetical protein